MLLTLENVFAFVLVYRDFYEERYLFGLIANELIYHRFLAGPVVCKLFYWQTTAPHES